jgi:hypothetical protein
LIALLVYHFVLRPLGRFIWVVPVEEHVAQAIKIHELETEIEADKGRKRDFTLATIKRLNEVQKEGRELRDKIRRSANKEWDKTLKSDAKKWQERVSGVLSARAPHFVGRFLSESAMAPQPSPFQLIMPGADAARWGDVMDRRLDSLQEIIERLAESVK